MSKEEFKEVLVQAIQDYFDGDKERISHSLKVLDLAERILEEEKGNPKVVIAAAALYDTGAQSVSQKPEAQTRIDGEPDSCSASRIILGRSGAGKEVIEAVCSMIEKRGNPRDADDLDSRIVHDARRLAMLREDSIATSKQEPELGTRFLTRAGRRIAEGFISAKEHVAKEAFSTKKELEKGGRIVDNSKKGPSVY